MIATLLAVLNPGDEVIIFEPFYENYGPDAISPGAKPRFVHAAPARLDLRPRRAARRVHERTRAIIVNTPEQPDRQGFSREELEVDRRLCQRCDASPSPTRSTSTSSTTARARPAGVAAGHGGPHGHDQRAVEDLRGHRLAGRLGDRTAGLTGGIRKVHDFLTVGAPAPLQEAGVARWGCRRVLRAHGRGVPRPARPVVPVLEEAGFDASRPAAPTT